MQEEPGGMGQPSLQQLEAVLEYDFRTRALLERALTHSSLAYERNFERTAEGVLVRREKSQAEDGDRDNEQLEFLGDAVIGLVVAQTLFERYPTLEEGDLTRLRAHLVSRKHLGQVAAGLELGAYMRLGRGEERSGGRKKAALLANCMEAVIGALYLDAEPGGGLNAVRRFVEREVVAPFIEELHRELVAGNSIGDHKSALQEFLQAHKNGQPEYLVKGESGPDHRKRFLVEVRVAGEDARFLARGVGTTKKKAEQEAARRAVLKLRQQEERKAQGAERPVS